MYENIKSIRPHFHSLREIQGNVSLDIKLPLNWVIEDILKPYRSIQTKVQDKNEKFTLLSIIANATQEGYDVVFAAATDVIKVNKELEEKEKLFQEKIKELELLFKKESLDKLKELTLLDNGQENTTSTKLVEEGDGKRSDGSVESQESDD